MSQKQAADRLGRRTIPALSDEEVARRVDLRLRRQDVLDRPENPLRLWAILDDPVRYRMVVQTDDLPHDRGSRLGLPVESRLGGSYYEEQGEIDEYIEIMNHVRVLALTPEHSADLVRTTRQDLP